MEKIREEAKEAMRELIETGKLIKGQIVVVGCSTSEVCGYKVGTQSNEEVAKMLFDGIYEAANEKGVFLAIQCCEHLNRAIIMEREALPYYAQIVNVIPQIKAGGAFATTAYNTFKSPVAVEEIQADAGLDIGQTMIGMHLKKVAVPVRLSIKKIGEALITAARVRPKFIGGCRAIYDENLK